MVFGFSVDDGWEPIIRRLSEKLEKLILDLPETNQQAPCAAQVKEKFGGLRFYMDGATVEMDAVIGEAERECYKTCETCGAPGKMRTVGWSRTLCDVCNAENVNRRLTQASK